MDTLPRIKVCKCSKNTKDFVVGRRVFHRDTNNYCHHSHHNHITRRSLRTTFAQIYLPPIRFTFNFIISASFVSPGQNSSHPSAEVAQHLWLYRPMVDTPVIWRNSTASQHLTDPVIIPKSTISPKNHFIWIKYEAVFLLERNLCKIKSKVYRMYFPSRKG